MEPYLAITPLNRGHAQNLEFGRENPPIWWWWGEGATDNGNRGGNRIGRDVQKIGGVGIRRLLDGGAKNKNERKSKMNSNEN